MNLHIVILWQGEKERGRKKLGKEFCFSFPASAKNIHEAIPNFCCVFLCCKKMLQRQRERWRRNFVSVRLESSHAAHIWCFIRSFHTMQSQLIFFWLYLVLQQMNKSHLLLLTVETSFKQAFCQSRFSCVLSVCHLSRWNHHLRYEGLEVVTISARTAGWVMME